MFTASAFFFPDVFTGFENLFHGTVQVLTFFHLLIPAWITWLALGASFIMLIAIWQLSRIIKKQSDELVEREETNRRLNPF